MPVLLVTVLSVICVNLITIALFWIDKQAAIKRQSRIPEKTLLLFALIGGTPGAFFAQQKFRHKTQKEPFRTLLILTAVFQLGAIGFGLFKPDIILDLLRNMQ